MALPISPGDITASITTSNLESCDRDSCQMDGELCSDTEQSVLSPPFLPQKQLPAILFQLPSLLVLNFKRHILLKDKVSIEKV